MILFIKTAKWQCTDKEYKQSIKKYYSFNNVAILCYRICGCIYVTNGQNKQSFLSNHALFSKKLVQKAVKKRTSNMKVYYIIPKNYRLTGHPENFKMKPYYFQERLSLRYNIIFKLLSLFHICFKENN